MNILKPPRVISRVSVELNADVSEISSVPIIRVDWQSIESQHVDKDNRKEERATKKK
jgi:hypothetical protein